MSGLVTYGLNHGAVTYGLGGAPLWVRPVPSPWAIDGMLLTRVFAGEERLHRPFPWPNLEALRMAAWAGASRDDAPFPTIRARCIVNRAHEAEQVYLFRGWAKTDARATARYASVRTYAETAQRFTLPLRLHFAGAIKELQQASVPEAVTDNFDRLWEMELHSMWPALMCGMVYAAALRLEELSL